MSSETSGSGSRRERELAKRVFARELNDAMLNFKEEDDEYAPVYVLLPTGERANRVFIGGTVVEINEVGEGGQVLQARVVDRSTTNGEDVGMGSFYLYADSDASQARRTLERIRDQENGVAHVTAVGKPRLSESEDTGNPFVAVWAEYISLGTESDLEEWTVETASQTLSRIEEFQTEDGPYITMAAQEYDTEPADYKEAVKNALEQFVEGPAEA